MPALRGEPSHSEAGLESDSICGGEEGKDGGERRVGNTEALGQDAEWKRRLDLVQATIHITLPPSHPSSLLPS